MKGITLAVIIALGASFSVPAMAEDDCKRALCMFGLLMGENDSTCSSAINSYFSILVWKRGKVKWSQTADKRMSALNSCPGADPDKMKNVNDKFGKLWGA
jgi:hypothetical protein